MLVHTAYRDSPYLTEALIARIDTQLEGQHIMADSFLCAQDIPESFQVETVAMSEDVAVVLRGHHVLNFEAQFASVNTDNVFPLLTRHDQIIVYDRQKQCYGERPMTVLEKGHTTAALDYGSLRDFLLVQLQQTAQIKPHHVGLKQ